MNIERRIKERQGSGGTDGPLIPLKKKDLGKGEATEPSQDQFGMPLGKKSWKGEKGRKSWK